METFQHENDLNFSGQYGRDEQPAGRPGGKLVLSLIKIVKAGLALFVLFILLAVVYLGLNYSKFRRLYSEAMTAKTSAAAAIFAFKAQDYEKAAVAAEEAQTGFSAVKTEISNLQNSLPAQVVPYYSAQLDSIFRLAASAESLSAAIGEGGLYVQGLQELFTDGRPFSRLSKNEKKAVLAFVYDSSTQFESLHASLQEAKDNLEGIGFFGVLNFLKPQISEYAQAVKTAEDGLAGLAPASRLVPELFGYPRPKTFLFLLQNSDELRATGGFIGTYGIVETDAGDIARLETHDIYHLDMLVDKKMNVKPPPPIFEYLNKKWFLRDSNWAPDFPAAAEKALWFFEEENRLAGQPESAVVFDGVIAITPELIESLLAYTGPIKVGGETYTQENFSQLLEYKVEKEFVQLGISRWQRKEVIGDIAKELKARLTDAPLNEWPEFIKIISQNAKRKDILIYWKDRDLQELAKEQNLAGEIKATDADFLMAVDFNMAALKTDAVMDKSLYYKVEALAGGLRAEARMTYRNQGTADWRTADYKTYTRFYVPLGAEPVSSEGIFKGELFTGQEFGKTLFGAFAVAPLGGMGYLKVSYNLPAVLRDQLEKDGYRLYVAKQPGNNIGEIVVDLNFTDDIKYYRAPDGFDAQLIRRRRLVMKGDLSADREFSVDF